MKEIILELVKQREWCLKQIDGNYANQKNQMEIYQPQIDKIDKMIEDLQTNTLTEHN